MSFNTETSLQTLADRAAQIDRIASQLQSSVSEYQQSPSSGNANANANANANGNASPLNLSANDAKFIVSQLKAIKSGVQKYELQRMKEKKHLAITRSKLKTELLALKKEQMVSGLKQTPDSIRKYFQTQLLGMRQEIVSLQTQNETLKKEMQIQQQQRQNSAKDSNVLRKVFKELGACRTQMVQKFAEYEQYKKWYEDYLTMSPDFESNKQRIRTRLILLRDELQAIEERNLSLNQEIAQLKQENQDYKTGKLLPFVFERQVMDKLQLLRQSVLDVETENRTLRMQLNLQQSQALTNTKQPTDESTATTDEEEHANANASANAGNAEFKTDDAADVNAHPSPTTKFTNIDPLLDMPRKLLITTIEMHTGGEPLRIVEHGGPIFPANLNLLQKRQHMISKFDHFRQFLMHEPRGHFDMYGAIVTEADPEYADVADFAVLFMHNSGYSSMCGHATIALGRYAIDFGLCKHRQNNSNTNANQNANTNTNGSSSTSNTNTMEVKFQVPCGLVTCTVEVDRNGRSTGKVTFLSPPSWAEHIKKSVHLEQFGKIELDIGFGGTFYAILPAARFNLDVRDSSVTDLINVATMVKYAVQKSSKLTLSHPESESKDLEFLYGTILTDGQTEQPSCNICVFADREVDRCPTGSGVMARLAIDYAKKLTTVGQTRKFIGKTGSVFEGCITEVIENYKGKEYPAVIVSVAGNANYVGRCTWYLEDGDNLGRGFLLK